jgi:glycerol-3-phosphate cytidylyltransferase-like family protein
MVSSYFHLPHAGHMEYIAKAKELAGPDGLVYAIVNNEHQCVLKKGFCFMPDKDRLAIISNLRNVDKAFLSIDTDRSCCKTIQMICDTEEHHPTIWYNDADVNTATKCPEEGVCALNGIELKYGTSTKVQSSTWIFEHSVKKAYEVMFS